MGKFILESEEVGKAACTPYDYGKVVVPFDEHDAVKELRDRIRSLEAIASSERAQRDEVLDFVRQYIIDETEEDSDFARTMIDKYGMQGFSRTVLVYVNYTGTVKVTVDDVPSGISADDVAQAVANVISIDVDASIYNSIGVDGESLDASVYDATYDFDLSGWEGDDE